MTAYSAEIFIIIQLLMDFAELNLPVVHLGTKASG